MKYSDIVKQGIASDDTPPGFSSSPNKNQNVKAKTQNTKQTQNSRPKTQNTKPEQVKKVEKKEPKTSEDTFMWNEEETTSDDSFNNDQSQSDDDLKVYGTGEKRYVKKGTDVAAVKKKEAEKKEAERKVQNKGNQKGKKGGSGPTDQNQVEFANIKQLMLRDYHSSLKHLDAIIKDMNIEIATSVESREKELNAYLKKLQQPKTEKSVWQGGERKQDNKPDNKGPRDNDKGKGQGQKGQGKGEGNQGQKGQGQGQGKGKGKKGKKAENAKFTITVQDKDGFLTERTLSHEENETYKKTGKLPELKVEQVATTVVETKKPVKKQINTQQVIANNPFSAVLLAGSFDAPEVDLAKNQQKKAQAAKKNKVKQQKLGEVQNQQIKQLEKQTSQQQATGKKNQGKNTKKKGAVQFVNKPDPKQKQPQQQKKGQEKPKKPQQKDTQEAHNKKQQIKKQQAEAEKKRQEKEEQRILANQRDIEKEKKLRRLARKNQKEDAAWYENEYAQPAALVGACTIFLAVVYSFVFQA